MMTKILNYIISFLQNPEGENSSKRLAGISTTLIMLCLASIGGIYFIKRNDAENFLTLIEYLCIYGGSLLGIGLAESFLKKVYEPKVKDSSGN